MNLFSYDIGRLARLTKAKATLYECLLIEAWTDHVHSSLKGDITFDEVLEYIEKNNI